MATEGENTVHYRLNNVHAAGMMYVAINVYTPDKSCGWNFLMQSTTPIPIASHLMVCMRTPWSSAADGLPD